MSETPRPAEGFVFSGATIESQKEEYTPRIDAKPLKAYSFREQSRDVRLLAKELCIELGEVNKSGTPKEKSMAQALHLVCNYLFRAVRRNPKNPSKCIFRYSCNHNYLVENVSGFTEKILELLTLMDERGWIKDNRQTALTGYIERLQSTFHFTPAFCEWMQPRIITDKDESNEAELKSDCRGVEFHHDIFVVVKENLPENSKEKNDRAQKVPVDIDLNPKRREKRRINNVLKEYNSLLSQTKFGLAELNGGKPEPKEDLKSSYYAFDTFNLVDNIRVQRQYADQNLNTHGRLYGGFWQSMPSVLRTHILINGNPTIECDYQSMQPNILFGLSGGHPVAKDVYYVPHYDQNLEDFDYSRPVYDRELIKQCFMLLVNSERPKETFFRNIKARLRGELLIEQEQYSPYSNESNLKELMERYELYSTEEFRIDLFSSLSMAWQPIWDYFNEGGIDWRHLTKYDSDIAFEIIKEMTALGVPVLTIHDSFIVETIHREQLIEVMNNSYSKVIEPKNGVVPVIKERVL